MKKQGKSTAARKPPVPTESHAGIDDWMQEVMPALQPIVKHLDKTIRENVSGLQYAIKWKKAYYGVPKHGWIIEMVAYDVSVNVVFLGGAKFDSPPPLGETGQTRYIKIKSLEEAEAPEIRKWIEEAGQVAGWKWPETD